jgi:hypothetical protein
MAGRPNGAHLVGSVPLPNAEAVFRASADHLGDRLRRVPDGETGPRLDWIVWQLQRFMADPQFEVIPPGPRNYAPNPRVALREGVSTDDFDFGALGYAESAISSFELFSELQASGDLPSHWRFQVSLPTPFAPISAFVVPGLELTLEAAYETAMEREIEQIAAVVSHERLAFQWDTAAEFGILEEVFPPYFEGDVRQGVLDRLIRYSTWVPADIELGYHLCYGDYEHAHFKQPVDAGKLADIANALAAGVNRPLTWIHLPVPRDRDDVAYFAPLADLALHDDTELYLGLVHFTDGVEGTERRVAAASSVVSSFGVATECGMGRRPPEQIPVLLDIHAAVSGAVT